MSKWIPAQVDRTVKQTERDGGLKMVRIGIGKAYRIACVNLEAESGCNHLLLPTVVKGENAEFNETLSKWRKKTQTNHVRLFPSLCAEVGR